MPAAGWVLVGFGVYLMFLVFIYSLVRTVGWADAQPLIRQRAPLSGPPRRGPRPRG